MAKGQKYELKCCKCGGATLVRGVTQIRETPETEMWSMNESLTEYACQRQGCAGVSYLIQRVSSEGVCLYWRDFK